MANEPCDELQDQSGIYRIDPPVTVCVRAVSIDKRRDEPCVELKDEQRIDAVNEAVVVYVA